MKISDTKEIADEMGWSENIHVAEHVIKQIRHNYQINEESAIALILASADTLKKKFLIPG